MEFCRILEKHNFEKIHTFQQDLSNNILIQGHGTGIRKSEMLFCCTSKWGGLFEIRPNQASRNFSKCWFFFLSKYASYVPLCCSLKGRKWDIETFETALNSSESVLLPEPGFEFKWTAVTYPPFKNYWFWSFQHRFERHTISFSPNQKAHWRHIVRFWISCKDLGDIQIIHYKLKILQKTCVLNSLNKMLFKKQFVFIKGENS